VLDPQRPVLSLCSSHKARYRYNDTGREDLAALIMKASIS
jgi:hypothetical protein